MMQKKNHVSNAVFFDISRCISIMPLKLMAELNGETSIMRYLYWQELFSHHPVPSQKTLFFLVALKLAEMQQEVHELRWMRCIRHT
jgi:hypothetical protein